MTSPLFTPFKLKNMELPNRVVMAPMTRSKSPGGVPGEDVAEYYARRAASDVGLIVTEGTTVRRGGASNDPNVPNLHKADALAGWKNVVEKVHANHGHIAPQIWHQGLTRKVGTGPDPDAPTDSPSGMTHTGKQVLPEPTSAEVDDMVMAFADAAADAQKVGFDCVELHGAHGYLIDEFFWDVMNKRSDRYGGSLKDRATFGADIIREVRKKVGPDMAIILRYSQWKQQEYTARPRHDAASAGRIPEDLCRCRRRLPARLPAPLLGTGIPGSRWREGSERRRLGQETDRPADHHCRLCRPVG